MCLVEGENRFGARARNRVIGCCNASGRFLHSANVWVLAEKINAR